MKNFTLAQPRDSGAATNAAAQPHSLYLAGGTTVIDLWKLGALEFDQAVDVNGLGADMRGISAGPGQLELGALERMNAVGEHADVKSNWPVVSQALLLSASPQIRNMGTMAGNLLQRPRSVTYRNPDPHRQDGPSRFDAIFGVTEWTRAPHPSDFAVAMMALDGSVAVQCANGQSRSLPLSALYQLPKQSLKFDTLQPGDLITAIASNLPFARTSSYIKIRDRASYQFAVVSAAAVLDVEGGTIRDARLTAGGVGTIPWRFPQVESALKGKPATLATYTAALADIGQGAVTHEHNAFKVELLKRTALRALSAAHPMV
jgi:xanthine dehydrogenase YagS FAD-binding subunit